MPGPYDNAPGAALPSSLGATPEALNAAVDAYKPTDTSTFLAKLLAEKQTMAKLAVASDLQSQIEYEKTQKQAELAILKAKQSEAEMFVKNSPKHQAALEAEYGKTIRDADAVRAGEAKIETDAAAGGLDVGQYSIDGKIDHQTMGSDLQIISARKALVQNNGYTPKEAADATGMTHLERINTPPPPPKSLDTAPVPSSDTATAALSNPIPPPTEAGGSLSAAPVPGAAPAAVAAAAIPGAPAVNSPVPLEQALEAGRVQIARAHKIPPSAVTQGMLAENLGLSTGKEIYVDPKTQDSYEVQVTKGRDGTIYKTTPPVLHERSKTQQTIDTEAAKDYQDYVQNHGSARDEKDLATLDESIKILNDPMTINASGAVVSLFPHALTSLFTTDRSLKVPNMIKSVVQNHLKEIFGARLSNMEVKNAMELVFNEKLDEKTNAETATRLRETLGSALTEKRASMQYFGEHGTLEGYKPNDLQSKPADTRASSTSTTSSSTAKAGTENFVGKRGTMNGKKYMIEKNEVNGQLEWVPQ